VSEATKQANIQFTFSITTEEHATMKELVRLWNEMAGIAQRHDEIVSGVDMADSGIHIVPWDETDVLAAEREYE
jgi:hypothetical protein